MSLGFLSACNISIGNRLFKNVQMLDRIELKTSGTGAFWLSIPVFNAGDQPSPPTTLTIDLAYRTDANGASLTCGSVLSNEPRPCAPPVQCSRIIKIQVPSLQPGEHWNTGSTEIGEATGACACRTGHCDGAAGLELLVRGMVSDPAANSLPNTRLGYTWYETGTGRVQGYMTSSQER
jgi:hypothetical protein